MRSPLARAGAAVLGVAVAALVAACSTQVAGSPQPLSSSPDVSSLRVQSVASVNLRKKFNESPQSINEYWSDTRLREAKPRDPAAPTGPPTPSTPARTPTTTPPTPTTTPTTPTPTAHTTPTRPTASTTSTRSATSARPAPTTSAPRTTAAPPPVQDPGIGRVIAPTRGHPKQVTLSNSSAGKHFAKVGLARSTAGRLYYAFGKLNYVCSATVVHSPSRDIVATAGHCVWDTEHGHGWGRNYMFIPDDTDNGRSSPYGRWFATRIYTTKAFISTAKENSRGAYGAGWAYDTAFLKIAKSNGRTIQQVTGGQGIAFGAPVRSLMVIGYPTAPPFNGRVERFCSSSNWYQGEFGDRTITCRMTPGCSGGGWLSSYNPQDGSGYVIGMTSIGNGRWLASAVMGGAASNTFDLAVRGG